MPIAYQFLPWVRRGLAVALSTEDNLGAGNALAARGAASIGVKLAAPHDGEAIAPLQMRLHGPGDVIGIDTRLVVRTDPKPQATNFEPNYLAIVDFDPPDFVWMLTPAKAQGDRRLRPWLVLVVLEVGKTGLPRMAPGALLPSVRIKAADVAAELPDLGESWSWAHTQLVNDDAAQIQADLQAKPASNVSRLVCPRRLKERTDYVACIVPAFEPGRLRGLGLVTDENAPAMTTLAPAWNKAAAADVVLPVYHHWEFSTGPKGDFESLARRLRTPGSYKGTPVEAQLAAVGTIPMSVDDLLNGSTPGLVTTMEGALVPISFEPGAAPPATQAESLEIIVNTPQDQVVNPVGDGATNAEGRRIEVKPPMVGAWHAQRHQAYRSGAGPATAPQLGKHWLADLNLNPRYRGAAGYGAEVVRKNQEDYVDACWDQIGDILAAEARFNLTRLAIEALGALKRKHFDVLPPERLMQVFGPALPRIEAFGTAAQTFRINGQIASLGGRLDRSSMPGALVDAALRRVASPGNRALRVAARLTRTTAALPALTTTYVSTMAKATTRPAAFAVNAFMPDGIVGTKMFDGVDLAGAAGTAIDLAAVGLHGARYTVGQVKQALASGNVARRTLAASGVPELKIRAGQHLGVFTDVHVGRFGTLVSNAPAVKAADWAVVASRMETLGERGIEGFLVESTTASAQLQVSAMRLDARSGRFTIDRVVGRFDAGRRALPITGRGRDALAAAALAGTRVGQVAVATSRTFNPGGLIATLPPNALVSTAGETTPSFTLDANLEFERREPGGAPPPVVSVTLPPAIRKRDVLKRFSAATKGAQVAWRDAFADRRVEVQVIDFPVAQAAAVLRARTDPAITLPARLASSVSIAEAALGTASPHVAAFLGKDATADLRFMIPALFDRVMAWPHLHKPLYADLVDYDKNAFMPGVDDLPQDLIMLVQVNQFFIDALMAGANVEMNRELLWRGFPTDLRGTPFQRFWRLRQDDMDPMHLWKAQPLGKRTDPNMTDPDRVALLVRGQLLRRYPNTAVYAWKKRTTPANPDPASPDHTQLMKDANGHPPAGAVQLPVFQGAIPPDITFFGFDIDKADVGDWCFVLEEQMSEPRFGFDVDVPAPGQPQGSKPPQRSALRSALIQMATPNNALLAGGYNAYKALSWSHLQVQAGANFSIASLINPPDKPFASFPTLAANPTAADIAKALLQQPFRAYYVGDDLAT
ncbi:hypothetical protein [Piscinibacter sp. XHJ-5]|uniref:hypothetical protein n=1 Tax=Piscinibacter sp. XHJ-5 TaxID=3037797 RepID=UPI0024531B45|nr:hypothetical protein [Piscinibacter sp. XHJ-5]